MRVIYKAPGCAPEPRDIPNTLEDLQATVGGYIETVTIASDAVIICNEEGRLHGLPHNCRVFGVDFVGPILIAGVDEDEFTDSAPHGCRLTMHKTPRQFCAARSLPESAAPLPGQSAAVKSLPISVPPPKHFLVVCSDSKRPCFRKPPDPYRNMWPLCLVFRRPQFDTIFQARFL